MLLNDKIGLQDNIKKYSELKAIKRKKKQKQKYLGTHTHTHTHTQIKTF